MMVNYGSHHDSSGQEWPPIDGCRQMVIHLGYARTTKGVQENIFF